MQTKHPLKIKESEFLKEVARQVLINESSDLKETISYISEKLNIPQEKVLSFIAFLKRHGFLVNERSGRYILTLNGLSFLLDLVLDFEEENHEQRRA